MTIIRADASYPGLPNSGRLSGTNGDLVGILDIVLVAAGWAIEFTSGNNRVYRPATGNRFRLTVQDDSGTSGDARCATVRGAESATNATTYTDPFPTVALIANANANWIKSSTANTTARAFVIYVGATWVQYYCNFGSTTNTWEFHSFGDAPAALSGDSYNTICTVRNSTNFALSVGFGMGFNGGTAPSKAYFARSYDGTVKSTQCAACNLEGVVTFGAMTGLPTAQSGPTTGIDRQKIILMDTGTTTTAPSATLGLLCRAYLPNLWNPLHGGRGSVNTNDTFTDTSYNASAAFETITAGNASTSGFLIVETSDTWTIPNG